jgi:hypothetical protein
MVAKFFMDVSVGLPLKECCTAIPAAAAFFALLPIQHTKPPELESGFSGYSLELMGVVQSMGIAQSLWANAAIEQNPNAFGVTCGH